MTAGAYFIWKNGGTPSSSSIAVQPRLQMSALKRSYSAERTHSGASQYGDPRTPAAYTRLSGSFPTSTLSEVPKSTSLTVYDEPVSIAFAHFRSRWAQPFEWMNARALTSWKMSRFASSSGAPPNYCANFCKDPPSRASMTIVQRPLGSSLLKSTILTTFGCRRFVMKATSRSAPAIRSAPATSVFSSFTASASPVVLS